MANRRINWSAVAAAGTTFALWCAIGLLMLLLFGCGRGVAPAGTRQAQAASAQESSQAAVARATTLHDQAVAASLSAAQLVAVAQTTQAAPDQLAAARAEGLAHALRLAAIDADARAERARAEAAKAAKEAQAEREAEAEAQRQAEIRTTCAWVGGIAGLAGVVGVVAILYLSHGAARVLASSWGASALVVGIGAPLYGASLPWIDRAAPWLLLALLLASAVAVVVLARSRFVRDRIIAADTHADLPPTLAVLAERIGWARPPEERP